MSIIDQLKTGDMRTIGSANQVVSQVLTQPTLVRELVKGLEDSESGFRMRCADALEKVSAQKPELVQPYLLQLVAIAQDTQQQEVQWHLAQVFERMQLSQKDQSLIVSILTKYLVMTKSNIVKVSALQTLTSIALENPSLKPSVIELVETEMKTGAASIIARGKKLLQLLHTHNT